MSWSEIALGVLAVLLCIGGIALEAYVYSADIWWHEPKTDRRNWPPPR